MMQTNALAMILLASCLTATPALADTPDEQIAAASALYDAHKYSDAAQRLDAFLAANPKHPKAGAAALVLGRCRTELKQYDKAVPAYEKAIASKSDALLPTAELGLGEAAYLSHQYEKSVTALAAALKTDLTPGQAAAATFWLGQSDLELKRYDAAEEAYTNVTRSYPRSDFADGAAYSLALVALRQGQTDVAQQRLRQFMSRYPRSGDRPQAMLLLAQLDLEGKRPMQARAGFEAVLADERVKGTPAAQEAEDGLIQALLALHDDERAAQHLEAALGRLYVTDPERFRAALTLGNCRYRQKQYGPAQSAYQEAARSSEPEVAAQGLYWLANTNLAQDKPGDAASQFAKFVARYPKDPLAPKAQLKAGDAYAAAKQTDAAQSAYRVVVDKFPQSDEAKQARLALADAVNSISDPAQLLAALKNTTGETHDAGVLRVARLYLQAKKYPEAVSALQPLLAAHSATAGAEAAYLNGAALDAQGKSALAATSFADAVHLAPTADWTADAEVRLAWLYVELKQPAKAETAASAALTGKLKPEQQEQARLAQLQSQLDQQKWDAALEGCKTLLASSPSPDAMPTILYTQAWVADKQNKPDDARPLWEKLISDYPKSTYAPEALLRLGDAGLKAEKYEEARDKYQQLLKDYANSSQATEAHFKLGSALYNLKQPDEAAAAYDAVSSDKAAGSYIPESLYWAGVAYDKADKKDLAIERLDKLVTDYPKHARVANAKIRLAALKAVAGK